MRRLSGLLILAVLAAMSAQAQIHSNTLNWTWSQGTGDAAAGFHVYKSATSGAYGTTPYATITSTSTLTYTDLVVVAGQVNYYVVTAFNAGGDSAYSNEVRCVTPFQAPASPPSLSGTIK